MTTVAQISECLQKGDADGVSELTKKALDEKLGVQLILDDGLIAGMAVVGERFKTHRIFLPDVLMAAKAMYAGMDLLKPLIIKEGIPSAGKVVMGTVQGDLHDIGKNLVSIMLKGAGFDVIDLGNDVPPEKFIDTAVDEAAQVIGLSALLTTTMPAMSRVVGLARERGIYGKVRIVVGGASLSSAFAEEIGADAYCYDGISAVECVKRFVGAG